MFGKNRNSRGQQKKQQKKESSGGGRLKIGERLLSGLLSQT